jgi:uncharacterized protein (TIGR00730 family)
MTSASTSPSGRPPEPVGPPAGPIDGDRDGDVPPGRAAVDRPPEQPPPSAVGIIDASVEAAIASLLDELDPPRNRRYISDMLHTVAAFAGDDSETLDLKIAASALREMRDAFEMFQPYIAVPKVTIFGSARTRPDDPYYAQAHDVAEQLARHGWMVITGAGPGIMHAAMEGAGRERSIGVSIRLPFEQQANPVIAGDQKYVSMKYFFTRKLMLIKESRGFVCLPGGFGTLDETFELLTLTQTGKGVPVPIVFLDRPGDTFWRRVHEFIERELVTRGLVAPADVDLYLVTDSCEAAVAEIRGFYANYDSLRYVGDRLVIRLRRAPTDAQLDELNERFAHLSVGNARIVRTDPMAIEVREGDRLDLSRISFPFAKHGYGDLRRLIDAVNDWVV